MIVNSVTNILLHEKIQQVIDHGNLNDTLKLRKNAQLHSVSSSVTLYRKLMKILHDLSTKNWSIKPEPLLGEQRSGIRRHTHTYRIAIRGELAKQRRRVAGWSVTT